MGPARFHCATLLLLGECSKIRKWLIFKSCLNSLKLVQTCLVGIYHFDVFSDEITHDHEICENYVRSFLWKGLVLFCAISYLTWSHLLLQPEFCSYCGSNSWKIIGHLISDHTHEISKIKAQRPLQFIYYVIMWAKFWTKKKLAARDIHTRNLFL